MKPTLICIFLLISLCITLDAQRPVEISYTQNDGLNTNQVIFLQLDVEGRLWVAYSLFDRFSRFDGLQWEHWDLMEEGISGNYLLYFSDEHGVWFQGSGAESDYLLLYSDENGWQKFNKQGLLSLYIPESAQLKLIDPNTGQLYNFFPDSSEKIVPDYFSLQIPEERIFELAGSSFVDGDTLGLRLVHPDPTMYLIECYNLKSGALIDVIEAPNKFQLLSKKLFLDIESSRILQYNKGNFTPIELICKDGKSYTPIRGIGIKTTHYINRALRVREEISAGNYIYHSVILNEDLEVEMFMENIHRSANNSVVLLPNGDQVYASGAGAIHRKNGILHLSDHDPNMVAGLHMIAEDGDGNIWFGGYEGEGGFAWFDGNEIRVPEDSKLQIGRMLTGAYSDKEGRVYFFEEGNEGIHAIDNGKKKTAYTWDFFRTGYFLKELSNGKIGVGANRIGFMKFDPENPSDYQLVGEEEGLDFFNILCFDEDKNGRIWMGRTSKGVAAYCFDNQLLGKWNRNNVEPLSDGAMSLIIDSTQQLWTGGNKGLYFLKDPHLYDLENGNLFDDWIKIALPGPESQFIISLLEVDQYLIAGSDYAIHFIPKDQDFENPDNPLIHSLSFESDIPGMAAEQNAILKDSRGYVWIGTLEGALRFDLDQLEFDLTDTEVELAAAMAGNEKIDLTREELLLPTGRRSLRLDWRAKGNVLLNDNVYYRISLFDKNGDPFYQADSKPMSTLINYLPPGRYLLRLEAIKNNQVNHQLEKMVLVPFLWFENPWHIFFLTMIGASILGLLVAMRYKQQRLHAEKVAMMEKNEVQMDQLRVKALSNYFNPHFINNVLHWIQSKYRKDPETTGMIGKLAENVQFLFHNTLSDKKAHPLSKELTIVDNYIAIALTRFGDIFEYRKSIKLDPSTLEEVKIPSLLIQIHVENAIEKGIRGGSRYGFLELVLHEDEDWVYIEVCDNGIGRQTKKETPKMERKSSTRVMEEIIQLLNKNNSKPIEISYEDNWISADNRTVKPHGTKVFVILPKNYHYG
ncbi:MAG: hypothetical protein EA411_12680 [Saprospirales bacterium]|nr:MAG: hypothetical protein EA411_12680 [Saprospirales bacterium]